MTVWSSEFPNRLSIEGKEHTVPRLLGLEEIASSDLENRVRVQYGLIHCHVLGKANVLLLANNYVHKLLILFLRFPQGLVLPTLLNPRGCREHELILISA